MATSQFSSLLSWRSTVTPAFLAPRRICWNRARVEVPQRRDFSIKELSWSSKTTSKAKTLTAAPRHTNVRGDEWTSPIDRFGIVACMSSNRVIGVNGHLPWNLPEDRRMFTELTRDRILVVGRRTLWERPNGSHIAHAASCIVLSKTLTKDEIDAYLIHADSIRTNIYIARSFPEALHVANILQMSKRDAVATSSDDAGSDGGDDTDKEFADIECWIAGGEPVYNAAVLHPSAKVMHLTIVDTTIEIASSSSSSPSSTTTIPAVPSRTVARFPPKYHWDTRFKLISANTMTSSGAVGGADDNGDINIPNEKEPLPITFTHHVWHRVKGKR